jgi:hypothetical protein
MAEHPVPDRLLKVITEDLRSRIEDIEAESPDGAEGALSILLALPAMADGTELEINWPSEVGLAAGAIVNITADNLKLAVEDEDGTQEIFCCDANCYPRVA